MDHQAIAKQAVEYTRLLQAGPVSAKKMAEMIRFLKTHGITCKGRDHDRQPDDRA